MGLKGLEMKLKDMHTYLEQVNKQKKKIVKLQWIFKFLEFTISFDEFLKKSTNL